MKKTLIIIYYWPPAGGPGVHRWLKFVKYLPDFQIEPIVYIPKNPTYPIEDKSLLEEVSPDLKIIKKPIFEPYKLANLLSKKKTNQFSSGIINPQKEQTFTQKTLLGIRGNIFIPDARKFWINPSVKFLHEYLKENKIDTIITTGPPHSVHLIGLKLKQKLNLKWIADFRDPWTKMWYFDQLRLKDFAKKKHEKLEKKVLQNADYIITTTENVKNEFAKLTSKPIKVITNGFDDHINSSSDLLDKKFTISHIGSFFSIENLAVLWEVLAELINENQDFKNSFQLNLIGKNNPELLEKLKEKNLINFTKNYGYLPHKKVLEKQRKSQVLLLQYTNEKIKGIIPGKLFEYLNAKRPILAIGPKDWEVKKIIEKTNSGFCFSFQDKKEIKAVLLKYFHDFQQKKLKVNSENIQQYHRKNLTKKLSKIIKDF